MNVSSLALKENMRILMGTLSSFMSYQLLNLHALMIKRMSRVVDPYHGAHSISIEFGSKGKSPITKLLQDLQAANIRSTTLEEEAATPKLAPDATQEENIKLKEQMIS
ncbi:hypothetical protein HAX54_022386 [Datura stramonium]|uniref:Uncharacterized protein n=1 Tax=Datura stramonium TaxID=4076 RepID=A0ABS8Y6E5_DATST|nr:hypothetical protein [Datura stramonium]